MGEVGRIAIIADPQGAYISAYQPAGEAPASEGVFLWDELGTTDADDAQRFYSEVFGWTTSEMGPEYGDYRVFNRGETGIAGLMTLPDATVPPHWQPYVAVDDPDATTAKAKATRRRRADGADGRPQGRAHRRPPRSPRRHLRHHQARPRLIGLSQPAAATRAAAGGGPGSPIE